MLDMVTAYVATALVFLCLAAVQFAGYATRAFGPWLGWWAGSNLLFGAGTLLVAFRTRIPDWLSINVANSVTILAYLALVAGVRSFAGRRPDWLLLGTVFTVLTSLCAAYRGPEFFAFRIVVASLCCALCDGLIVFEALRLRRREELVSATLLAGAFALTGAGFVFRAGLAAFGWTGQDFMFSGDPLNQWMTVSAGIFVTVRGMVLLFLVVERNGNRLRHAAWTDPLTGAWNRLGLDRAFAALARPDRARPATVALLVVDLDHFKRINDSRGHAVGDAILRLFAQTALACLPARSAVARYGGDEFVLLIPGRGPRIAEHHAHNLRGAFAAALGADRKTASLHVTLSIGIACGTGPALDLDELIAQADMALYRAKALGRDRVSSSALLAA